MVDRNTRVRSSQLKDGDITSDDLSDVMKTSSLGYSIDGNGSAIPATAFGIIEVPFDCEIQEVALFADVSGSIQVNVLKATYANYPTFSSIVASAKPTISSSTKAKDSTLTGWSKTLSAGDVIKVYVDSNSSITKCLFALKVKKT